MYVSFLKRTTGFVNLKVQNRLVSRVSRRPEAVAQRGSVKKVFLDISQNSQEPPVPESLFK